MLSFAFVILPASCALLTPSALMLTYPLAVPKSALLKLAIPLVAEPASAAAVASLKESLLCAIAALALMSAFTIAPAVICPSSRPVLPSNDTLKSLLATFVSNNASIHLLSELS